MGKATNASCRGAQGRGVTRTIVLSAAVSLLATGPLRPALAVGPPNLVVIMADDLSNNAFETLRGGSWLPNIQQLADQGVSFDNSFVTTPLCAPSRATFLTGLYSHNHAVFANTSANPNVGAIGWPGWFPTATKVGLSEFTVATWLQAVGYTTGYIGKYLNGYGKTAPASVADPKTYVPPGWDDWQGLLDPTTYKVYDYEINDNGTVVTYGDAPGDYQTDVLAARSVQFIQEASALGAPFFLTVAPLAPHIEVLDALALLEGNDTGEAAGLGIRPAPRHSHLSDGNAANGEVPALSMSGPSFNEADVTDKPSCPSPTPPAGIVMNYLPFCIAEREVFAQGGSVLSEQWKTMLASMLAVDDMVGSVVNALAAAGELDNTVILFTSDNGWLYGEHRMVSKHVAYDEASRVPLIIRAPGYAAGAAAAQPVLNSDLAPTLAAFAGATAPYNTDGTSLLPLLSDPTRTDWHRKGFLLEQWFIPSYLKFMNPTYFAVRKIGGGADYLYVGTQANQSNRSLVTSREFYNYASDPFAISSIALPQATATVLDNFINALRQCNGARCRQLEGF